MRPEVWKDVPGYEGYYQVSDRGRFKSLDRVVNQPAGPKYPRVIKGRMLCPVLHCKGFYVVKLSKRNIHRTRPLHHLVAAAFLERPEWAKEVSFINRNKLDCAVENIKWVKHASRC